ncbi:MAG TPA: hypothetical protein VF057_09965 [Thermoanaerobaculia bacterium]
MPQGAAAYPKHTVSAFEFVSGRVPRVTARVRRLDVPDVAEPMTEPGPARDAFNAWIDEVWRKKDELLRELIETDRDR